MDKFQQQKLSTVNNNNVKLTKNSRDKLTRQTSFDVPLKLLGSSKLRLNNGSALKLQIHFRILIRYSSHRVRPLKILRNLNLTATAGYGRETIYFPA
jgi:hypothetical protein